jgi:hypothetical protein
MKSTKTSKLQAYMATSGAALTAKQIKKQFGLKNPHEAIRSLRQSGVCVYGNVATLSDGTKTVKYRVGRPTKAMVAAAYASAGGDLFTA